MNILILTPDRVGSTLLQRLITVYANAADKNNLTINLHELTNGIVKYYNDKFGKEVLGKKENRWGYYQSLSEIARLIDSSDHDVTSRMAFYHIKNRKDSLADQLSFYEYLNNNFFIVSARRQNLFEHALSWVISAESKKLNVYSFEEKYENFKKIVDNGITVDQEALLKYLNRYLEYIQWVDNHFNVNSYFYYERDLPNIENYILNLSPFRGLPNITWENQFGISWENWNRMHYLLSLVLFNNMFTQEEKTFMKDHLNKYTIVRTILQDFQDDGILVSGIPIKLQTLKEKTELIGNFDQTLLTYNNWGENIDPSRSLTYNKDDLKELAAAEHSSWQFGNINSSSLLANNEIPMIDFRRSDLKDV